MAAERVQLKAKALPVRGGHGQVFQIDGHAGIGALAGVLHQHIDDLLRHDDGQDAVLEAVVVEDVGKAGRDHAADAVIQQRPGRMFARAAAAEIVAGDDDLAVAIGGLVQDEIRDLGAVGVEAHLVEQVLAQTRAVDRLQELLGNDHVGVDIDQRHGRRDAGQGGELVHMLGPRGIDLGRLRPLTGEPTGAWRLMAETGVAMFLGFSDLAALRACIARDWTPTIGDPEITGWLTVISYLVCLVLAVMVLRRRPARAARGLWLVIAGADGVSGGEQAA
jgi:hypothetical protein